MEDQHNWAQWISYWVGYVEEANKDIDFWSGKRSKLAREHLARAKQSRDKGLKKIEQLGGKADLVFKGHLE